MYCSQSRSLLHSVKESLVYSLLTTSVIWTNSAYSSKSYFRINNNYTGSDTLQCNLKNNHKGILIPKSLISILFLFRTCISGSPRRQFLRVPFKSLAVVGQDGQWGQKNVRRCSQGKYFKNSVATRRGYFEVLEDAADILYMIQISCDEHDKAVHGVNIERKCWRV